jgi:hypothetical protein
MAAMGEYEDRYPDAYGRDETEGQPPEQAEVYLPPRQHRQSTLFRTRFGGADPETAPAWQHGPTAAASERPGLVEPTAPPRQARFSYRGLGPRGYVRSDQRILDDVCDRLTENPFIDASDIEVTVRDRTVMLAGSVDTLLALHQAEEIAREVAGVANLRNELIVAADERRETTSADRINRAMPAPDR